MADVRVASTGDGIPLLDPDGGGVYNVGKNNSHDIRYGLLSSLYASSGSSFSCRPGVLPRSFSSGVVGSFQVTQNSTPNRFINVAGGIGIHTRTGEGPYPGYSPATVNIQASAANVTNPRIDLVVSRMYDKAAFPADPFHGHYIEIIEGTAAAIPVAPAVPDGAIPLAQLNREASGSGGDTITTAKIQDLRKGAQVAGAPRLLFAGDSASDAGAVPGEQRYRIVSGILLPMEYWGADTKWHGTQDVLYQTIGATASGAVLGSPVAISISVADPGWEYYIEASGALAWDQGIGTTYAPVVQITTGPTTIAEGISIGDSTMIAPGGNRASTISPRRSAVQTGAKTVQLVLLRNPTSSNGASGVQIYSGGTFNHLSLKIVPA